MYNDHKAILSGALLGLAAALAPVGAAAQSYDWSGFYAGAHLGGATFGTEASDLTDTFTNDAPQVQQFVPSYGIVANYNWLPFGDNLMVGVELDGTFGLEAERFVEFNAAGTDGLDFQYSWDSLVSLRARAGVVNDKVLTYVAAGPAFAEANFVAKDLDPSSSDCSVLVCAEASESLIGVAVGAGVEYAFREDFTARFEFIHYEMPTTEAPLLTGRSTPTCSGTEAEECTVFFESSSTLFRAAVSYKF